MLPDDKRQQLDSIVQQMTANKESDSNIRFVVDDFKKKYTSQPKENPNTYGALFRAKPNDNPLEAGLKAAGNLIPSAFNFGKGIVSAITNPIDTAKAIGSTAAGGVQKLIPGQQGQEQNFDQFTSFLKERYGSLENLQKTATEDPFGFGSDVVGLFTGGAALAGRGAEATNLISKAGKVVTRPAALATEKAGDIAAKTARFAGSQATGLNPETITELLKNPKAFKNIDPEIRMQTAQQVGEALDGRLEELSNLGKEYETIRASEGIVEIPQGTIQKVLDKYGVKLDKEGSIVTTSESRPLSTADRNALQDFIGNYGKETQLSPNAFLNTREALSNLSKYEQGKTSLPQQIARDLRAEYDSIGKAKIPGLKELDNAYAPERELLGQLKKDIFDAKGELKDGAISKIANITGKGREKLLERVKQVIPDIDQRVRVLKAVEDIERSSGLKVGTYARAGIGLGGVLTGNVPVIIGAILAQPEIAVPLLKGAGYVGNKVAPILNTLRSIVEDVNAFRMPASFLNAEGNPKLGLSLEDVSRSVKITDELKDVIGKELSDLDTRPLKVDGKLDFGDDADFRLEQLKEKINEGSLTNPEYNEALNLLKKKGIDVLKKNDSSKVVATRGDGGKFTGSVSSDPLITEARKYKSAEEFVSKIQGSATQYGDYTPQLRHLGMEDYKNVAELGVKPEKMVTIYRGIDDVTGKIPRKINDGDFVTTDFDSAMSYAGKDNVVSMKVPAKTLYTDAIDDFKSDPFYIGSEYVYTTQKVQPLTKSQLTDIWNKANKKK